MNTEPLHIAREYPPADESIYINRMIDDLQQHTDKLYKPGEMQRQTHPKMHGCVQAEFTILDNIPQELKVGIFKEPKTYNCLIRYSNSKSTPAPDIEKDIRGMAVKLTGVTGKKLLDTPKDNTSQDFLLISSETFISKNVKEFQGLLHALKKGPLPLILHLIPFNLTMLKRLLKAQQVHNNILDMPYWSTVPYMFGTDKAVKYHVRPANGGALKGSADRSDDNFLKTNMVKNLSEQDVYFDFFVQFQTDANTMPIEDPTISWASPYQQVARIKIPKQVFDTPDRNFLGDDLSFSPWHALEEHKPIGGLNRARKAIYGVLSSYWHDRNEKYKLKT